MMRLERRPQHAMSGHHLQIDGFADIRPELDAIWLVDGLLPIDGIGLIYGHPGSGKSFVALDIAMHVALGWAWHGRKTRQGSVLFVAAEGGRGLARRIDAMKRHYGVEEAPFGLLQAVIDLQNPDADIGALIEAIEAQMPAIGGLPALVVIDTVSKTFGSGNENGDDMAKYVANCAKIASTFGCLVIPVHHRPKDTESKEPRGHGSLKGGVDVVLLVEDGRKGRRIEVTKQKDGETGLTIAFALKEMPLGFSSAGDAVTSCIVLPQDAHEDFGSAPRSMPPSNKFVLAVLREITEELGSSPSVALLKYCNDGTGIPPRVVEQSLLRDHAIERLVTDRDMKRDTAKKNVNRALDRLKAAGDLRFYAGFVWTGSCLGHSGTGRDIHRLDRDGRDKGL